MPRSTPAFTLKSPSITYHWRVKKVNKEQAYNRIAKATIKALKEQAEMGKVNELTTEAVYLAIDNAFTLEQANLFKQNEQMRHALQFIAQGENLDQEKMMTLAQQALTPLQNK